MIFRNLNSGLIDLYSEKNGAKEKINVNLASFSRGYPDNTAMSNTTKRKFTKGTYIVGLAGSNYYNPSAISNYTMNSDGFYMRATSGYGIYYVLPDSCTPTNLPFVMRCKVNYSLSGQGATQVKPQVITYLSDGTYNKDLTVTYIPTTDGSHVFEYKIKNTNANIEYILFGLGVDMNTQITISDVGFFIDYSEKFDLT